MSNGITSSIAGQLANLPNKPPTDAGAWLDNGELRYTPQYQSRMSDATASIVLVNEGHSLAAGLDPHAPGIIAAEYGSRVTWTNVGSGGKLITQMISDFDSLIRPLVVDNATFVTLWPLINTLRLSTTPARVAVDLVWTWCKIARDAGIRPIVLTTTPSNRPGEDQPDFEERRVASNAMIRNEWQGHCSAIIDVAADPRFYDPDDTIYYADGIHPTAEGFKVVSRHIVRTINGLIDGLQDGSPLIVSQPPSVSPLVASQPASLQAIAVGDGTQKYQWQISENNGASFSDIQFATEPDLVTTALTSEDVGRQYRAVITNRYGSVATTATKITDSFTPADIPSVAGYWDSESLLFEDPDTETIPTVGGQPVGSWLSGVGDRKFTQPLAANQPTLITNEANGKPIVRLDGVNDRVIGDAAIPAKSMAIVAKFRGAAWGTPQFPGLISPTLNTQLGLSLVGTQTGNTAWQGSTIDGDTVTRRNGVPQLSVNAIPGPFNEFVIYILRNNTAFNFIWQLGTDRQNGDGRSGAFDIAAVAMFDQYISDADCELIESWAADQYGVGI